MPLHTRPSWHNFNPAFGRVLFAFLCLALAAGVFAPWHGARAAGWYSPAWAYRNMLTINSGQVAGSATSFPVLISSANYNWRSTSFGGHVLSATGSDFVVTAGDGATKLDYEVESYASSTGALVAWARLPFLSTTTTNVLYVYYGNASESNQQNPTGVWNSNYTGVWHLSPTSTSAVLANDSTGNGNTGTTFNSPAWTTGKIGGGLSFNGTNQDAHNANDLIGAGGGPVTISLWLYLNSYANTYPQLVCNSASELIVIGPAQLMSFTSNNDANYAQSATGSIPLGQWVHVAVTRNYLGTANIYINGVLSGLADQNSGSLGDHGATYIGNGTGDNIGVDGQIDEVRIFDTVQSASWIQTEYNNQSSPSTFYSLNAEEPSRGYQVSSRSDTLSNSQPSATSNHTVVFTVNNAIRGSSVSGSSTVTLSLPSDFAIPAGMDCGDVDAATSVQFSFNYPGCHATATAWGFSATGSAIVLTPPSGTGVYVPTSTQITIKIGSNATVGQQGAHWITNPSSAGIYTISVGGTFGGSGNMLVSINAGVSVAATVAESLSLTITGIASGSCTADDGASVNPKTTTANTVPFGTVSPNAFTIGCQDLAVSTNAGNGYSLAVQEQTLMQTAGGGFTIPDTACDAGACTEAVAGAWTNAANNGLGHTCANQSMHDCAAAYSSGVNFRQFANIAGGETVQAIMSSSTPATATGRVKYRLSVSSGQPAGQYTNLVTFTITATY